MRIDVHVFHHMGEDNSLSLKIDKLIIEVKKMTQATDELNAAVAAQKTVLESAVAMITGFPDLVADAVRKALEAEDVEDAATDAAVTQARADMEANTQPLKDALVRNTPEA